MTLINVKIDDQILTEFRDVIYKKSGLKELYVDGGIDALENFFFVIKNRIIEEIKKDPEPFRSLWNGIDEGWSY